MLYVYDLILQGLLFCALKKDALLEVNLNEKKQRNIWNRSNEDKDPNRKENNRINWTIRKRRQQ